MTTDKVLDKLKKIQAMAEGAAAIGNEAEAQAFAELLQRMLVTHKLEMTDLEFEVMEKTEPVTRQSVDLSKAGIAQKKTRTAWLETLASIIARAHFCRILVQPGSNNIALVGRAEDRAVAEYMLITLARATETLAKNEHQKYCWQVYKRDGNCSAARGFKESFITGFIIRIDQRLKDARNSMVGTSTALVRVNKSEEAVAAFMKENFKAKAGALARMEAHNGAGYRKGTEVANSINLTGKAVGGGADRKQLS